MSYTPKVPEVAAMQKALQCLHEAVAALNKAYPFSCFSAGYIVGAGGNNGFRPVDQVVQPTDEAIFNELAFHNAVARLHEQDDVNTDLLLERLRQLGDQLPDIKPKGKD
jgi:hypothetical protein